ncbi:MAG TPA: SRPBCC family protein [Thermoanaerobaculia bacterium]|nr:SRPBCC family protein [Thermoanaerobaculia bacterium]
MSAETFIRRVWIDAPADEVFRWHAGPEALQSLIPPWERVEVAGESAVEEGAEVRLVIRLGPLSVPWIARIEGCVPGRSFRDVQVRGPFARWEHEHRMEPAWPGACWLEDRIVYKLPLGPLGRWLGGGLVRSRLERMFEYRHRVTVEALAGWQDARRLRVSGLL